MDIKQLGGVQIKDADRGEFSAVIATYGVIDKDGDVTEPGAHQAGAVVPVSAYGHASWGGALPVGLATLRTTKTQTIADGRFFLETTAGSDTFQTVKHLGPLGQWSYGYDVIDSEMGEMDGQRVRFLKQQEIHEVSPVLLGAGVNTRTLATKAAPKETTMDVVYKAAIRPHETPVTARDWHPTAVTDALAGDTSVTDLRSIHAWVAPDGDPESKSSYRFPHHHGPGGPANVRALITGIGVLNGARGGTTLSDNDRKAVYEHLASHLRDADRDVPDLKAAPGGELTFHEEAINAMAVVSGLLDSAARVAALRAAKGKNLSHINVEILDWINDDLCRLQKQFRTLLDTPTENAAVEYVRFLAQQHRSTSP